MGDTNYSMTFDQMREELENWLREASSVNGTWKKTQKDRQLNLACLKFVSDTKHLLAEHTDKTVEDQNAYDLPIDYLNSHILFVDNARFRRVSLEEHVAIGKGNLNNFVAAPYEYYYVDRVNKQYVINPADTESDNDIQLTYVRKPNKLVTPEDVSEINEIFHEAIPAYAAYKMLPKETEGETNGVGRDAMIFYEKKVIEALEFENHETDDNVNTAPYGPEFLAQSDVLDIPRKNFDRFS